MRDGRTNKQTTSEDRATQLLIWETLSLAIILKRSHWDDQVEASEGEADEDALVDVHCPVEDVAPQERQLQGQGANNKQSGVGDRLWKGNLVWCD